MRTSKIVGPIIGLLLIAWAVGSGASQNEVVQSSTSTPDTITKITSATVAPYGSWRSPLTAASLFRARNSVSYLSFSEGALYFIERQAAAKGRNILFRMEHKKQPVQQTPGFISVRTRVHEYGGMPYFIDGTDIYYSNFTDQKIYRISSGQDALAITPDSLRYMSCIADDQRKQLICIREDHRGEGEAINTLVAIDMKAGGEGKVLFEGTDFVAFPTVVADSGRIAFITWSHPNMPWDNTQLQVARISADGLLEELNTISQRKPEGDGKNASINSPQYSDNGTLYFLADWSDWGTLYRLNEAGLPELVLDMNIEIQSYILENDSTALISYAQKGQVRLARVNLNTGTLQNIGAEFSRLGDFVCGNGGVYFLASTMRRQGEIYYLKEDKFEVVYSPATNTQPNGYFSEPESIIFSTGTQEFAHGFFYAPQNQDYSGPDKQLPPLIVKVHGGPVGASSSTLDLSTQFWTSRGFAVFDVNHRGSTGFGREFRKKLYPNWGVIELEDVAAGVRWLVQQGLVDGNRAAIRGGSAGGYTVLASLAFMDIFRAGTSYFGISDLEVLTRDTHKFESRYLDQLVGPYPESRAIYRARSPIHSVDNISVPLLLLQGLEDKVVPPNQSELIFEALKANCVPVAYLAFAGEGHGFRKPENNIRALNAELSFYGQVFGFEPSGNLEPLSLKACK